MASLAFVKRIVGQRMNNTKVSKETEELLAKMRDAGRLAGLRADDPLMPLFAALMSAMRHILARTTISDRIASHASKCIADAVMINRAAVDAAVDRLKRELRLSEKNIADRVVECLLADLPMGSTVQTAKARRWRGAIHIIPFIIGVLAGSVFISPIGELTSSNRRLATISSRDGPDVAAAWENLMLWNNLRAAWTDCDRRHDFQEGRRFCRFDFWIEGQQSSTR